MVRLKSRESPLQANSSPLFLEGQPPRILLQASALAGAPPQGDQHIGMPYPERSGANCGMTLIVNLPDELEAVLLAHGQGTSADRLAQRVLEQVLTAPAAHPGTPFETGRGMLAQYGPAPSAAEIDANRVDMFRGFAEDFR
jgi:hypothetical protein